MGSDLPVALLLGGVQIVLGLVALRIGWWVIRGIRRDRSGPPTPAPQPPQGPGGTRAISPRPGSLHDALGRGANEGELPRAA